MCKASSFYWLGNIGESKGNDDQENWLTGIDSRFVAFEMKQRTVAVG